MLSKGFTEQIQHIFRYLPVEIQITLFSATMPDDCIKIATKFMRDPARILVKKEQLTLEGIHQYYVACERDEWKFDILLNLYENLDIS